LAAGLAAGAGTVFEVGPEKPLRELNEVPWEALEPGDTVRVHWREQAYRGKFVLCRRGTPEAPIRVAGIAAPDGRQPVVDGRDATTRAELNYWGEERGVVKIGGANQPPDLMPAHVVLEGFEIRSGRQPYAFQGRNGRTDYLKNAAAVFLEKGEHIVLRDLTLHDSGNGLFVSPASRDVLVEGCRILGNGVEGSIYEHNAYTQARGIVYQHNRFGPLRAGCPGNNLKDRSAGLVVRCNWIEGGNRQLDLVDGRVYADDPAYRRTYVYGNVLIERDHGNRQMVHYGGDSERQDGYRKGMLYFYHNTVVSKRSDRTTLIRLSTNDEQADIRNNIIYATAGGSTLEIMVTHGRAVVQGNWLSAGWQVSFPFSHLTGTVTGTAANLAGDTPGFADPAEDDFRLLPASPCLGAAGPLHGDVPDAHRVLRQWEGVGRWRDREDAGTTHLGAFGPVAAGSPPPQRKE
jgi:hypothetical protein